MVNDLYDIQKTPEELQAFISDLAEVCKKHRLSINGCGCCGSPFLENMPEVSLGGNYKYDTQKNSDGSVMIEHLVWESPSA